MRFQLLFRIPRVPCILSFPRFIPERGVHRCTYRCTECIPTRVYFNINNWRANFPRARARVISGRRDGDASVCDRDPAASCRLRHSVSFLFFPPSCLFLRHSSAFRVAILFSFLLLSFLRNFMSEFLTLLSVREQKFASY